MILALTLALQDSAPLIEQLRSPDPAVREEATRELIRLGDAALAPLREARAATSDGDYASRLNYAIAQIERLAPVREAFVPAPAIDLPPGPVDFEALSAHFDIEIENAPETALAEVMQGASLLRVMDAIAAASGREFMVWTPRIEFDDRPYRVEHATFTGPFMFGITSMHIVRDSQDGARLVMRVGGAHERWGHWFIQGAVEIEEIELADGRRMTPRPGMMTADEHPRSLSAVPGPFQYESSWVFDDFPSGARRIVRLRGRARFGIVVEWGLWEWDVVSEEGWLPTDRGPSPAVVNLIYPIRSSSNLGVTTTHSHDILIRVDSGRLLDLRNDPIADNLVHRGVRFWFVNGSGEQLGHGSSIDWYAPTVSAPADHTSSGSGVFTPDRGAAGMRLRAPLDIEIPEVEFEFRDIPLP